MNDQHRDARALEENDLAYFLLKDWSQILQVNGRLRLSLKLPVRCATKLLGI